MEPFGTPTGLPCVVVFDVGDPDRGVTADDASFDALYRRRWASMVRLAYLLTGSTAVSEEVVQDAFIAVRDRWSRVEQPDAYLRTTVVNRARTAAFREARERTSALGDHHDAVLPPEVDETWERIRRLPERQRAVVVLRFYEDLSEQQIAEVLGCRVGTVKSRLHRALSNLRGS